MMSPLRLLATVALGLLLSQAAPAQCQGPKSVQIQSYGKTCLFFNQPSTLAGRYDPSRCTLTLTLTRPQTCCNTFLSAQFVLIGATAFDPGLPAPILVPGCLLSLAPILVLPLPLSANGVLALPLPPIPGPVTFYAQGLNDFFTTIGFTHDFMTSDALRLDAQ